MLRLTPHPELHLVFEALAYIVGYVLYRRERGTQGDTLNDSQRLSVVAGVAVGALIGSRVLGLAEQSVYLLTPERLLQPGGKTIVGGLLGGWLGAEIAKRMSGIRVRTGDVFAVPLCVGIAIGRVGCFLAGLADDTYGTPTQLPWAVDFGDGVPRHPAQLYEIVFLLLLAAVIHWAGKRRHREGALFRLFMAAYLFWRLLIDFIKPQPLHAGLNMIQWACLVALLMMATEAVWSRRRPNADCDTRESV